MIANSGSPLVYLITDGTATNENIRETRSEILNLTEIAVEFGIPMVQIREKNLSAKALFELTVNAAAITRGSPTRLLVNDRADIALAAGADGVHLTSSSIPTEIIRAAFPAGFLIGVSTHSGEETLAAATNGADFTMFGPVFSTPGKGKPKGLQGLMDACSLVPGFPVIAVGGIDQSNYESVLRSGAAGFAAIRWLNDVSALRGLTLNK